MGAGQIWRGGGDGPPGTLCMVYGDMYGIYEKSYGI